MGRLHSRWLRHVTGFYNHPQNTRMRVNPMVLANYIPQHSCDTPLGFHLGGANRVTEVNNCQAEERDSVAAYDKYIP